MNTSFIKNKTKQNKAKQTKQNKNNKLKTKNEKQNKTKTKLRVNFVAKMQCARATGNILFCLISTSENQVIIFQLNSMPVPECSQFKWLGLNHQ